MFNERDRRCAPVQFMLSIDSSYDNRTIASTLKMQIWIAKNNRDVPSYGYGLWLGFKWGPHHATWHVWSRLESQHQSVPGYAEECGAVRWPVADPGCDSRTWRRPASPKSPRLGFRRSATTLYPSLTAPSSPDLNPLEYFVWSFVENITNMTPPQYQSQPDRRHPPSIHRASAGACEKGMLPVPDLYRGGDWGWRRLHWIDVSSTT